MSVTRPKRPRTWPSLGLALLVLAASAATTLAAARPATEAFLEPANVPASSCQGEYACDGLSGSVGENSCNEYRACFNLEGSVGDNSCNGWQACHTLEGTVGANSCNDWETCYGLAGSVGSSSCNGYQACLFSISVGNGSCNEFLACLTALGDIGNYSCNSYLGCYPAPTGIGDCEFNAVTPDPCAQPDAMIRRPGGARLGNGIYNTTGDNQTWSGPPRRYQVGDVRWFYVYAQNDGLGADSLTIAATDPGSSAGFAVSYFRPSLVNITAAVEAGTFATPTLAPGSTYAIRVRVEVLPGASHGSSVSRLLTIASTEVLSKQDAVGFTLRKR